LQREGRVQKKERTHQNKNWFQQNKDIYNRDGQKIMGFKVEYPTDKCSKKSSQKEQKKNIYWWKRNPSFKKEKGTPQIQA
jgi:uncharacterized protein (DUF2461 family)